MLANRRELINAEFALNEGGGGTNRNGRPYIQGVQVSEKMFVTFDMEATNPGGHSSVPQRDNAIYDLSAALDRLSRFEFPVRLGYVTRRYFSQLSNIETGALSEAIAALAQDKATDAHLRIVSDVPRYNAQLRTTCVATRLEGGHADNALPQRAKAAVNCRLMPREDPDFVLKSLVEVAGPRVSVKPRGGPRISETTDAQSPAFATIQRVSEEMWPAVPVVPIMSTGATDGSRLRNAGIPTYGTSGIFVEYGEIRMHGRDERVQIKSFFDGSEFLYRLVKALSE